MTMNEADARRGVPSANAPEIDDLLRAAADHALGTDFLLHGSLDSVAATFGVHAFVIDAARDAWRARAGRRTAAARR